MSGSLIIDVHNLRKSFGELEAVRGVDLQVEQGEIFGLLGPDGAGKTTTIRMLVGIMDPSEGTGTVLGRNLLSEREEIKKHIGYVSQRFSLYGDLTIAENLDFFSEIYEIPVSERREREERMLDFSRLRPFTRRLAQNLSGGMKQKLALSCTLMHEPKLLFLDEPTTGVDPVSRRDFWKILYQLVAEGMTLVVSTPYMDEAERCTRLAMMDKGRVVRLDTPAGLKSEMKGSIIEVVAEPLRKAKAALNDLESVSSVQLFGDRIHVTAEDTEAAKSEITQTLSRHSVHLESMRELAPGLEDVFVSTIEKERQAERGKSGA